eukprot:gene3351-2005_t
MHGRRRAAIGVPVAGAALRFTVLLLQDVGQIDSVPAT